MAGSSQLLPSPVIPGSQVQETTALRGIPRPAFGQSTLSKIAEAMQVIGASFGDIERKTGAGQKTIEFLTKIKDDRNARASLGYMIRLQQLAVQDPSKASAALADLNDFILQNAENLPVQTQAVASKLVENLKGIENQEQARQAMESFTTATQILSDPAAPPASKFAAAHILMKALGPEKAALAFPQIIQMAGLVSEQAPKALQAVKGERGELLSFDPNTGLYTSRREAGPESFDPKTEAGKIVKDISGMLAQGVPQDSPIIGALARQLQRLNQGPLQSPLGKALEDQKLVVAEHGKGSLQAQAFGEYIQKLAGAAPPSLGDIGGIRKEFAAQSKDFITIRDSYKRILSVGREASAAGDMALIFNYMKMLDPGSVVRESEYATAANAAGVPERVRAYWNRLLSGERLGPEQRKDFINRAHDLFDSQRGSQMALESEYRRIAKESKVDPSLVSPDFIGDLRSFNARDTAGPSTEDAVRILKKGLGR